ncbi:aldehyde ferredoxin oxidoreductase family protein [Romboutsia sp.]|uniref:aldehyde ferredoxin oxidoreductase family protein n=1 Tax=Romboutsia sp. TaxID=1965302 RepID=UPI003F34CA18
MQTPIYCIIDLTKNTTEDYIITEEEYKNHLGGKTLGAYLLTKLTPAKLEKFSPENIIIINTGPMNGTLAPSSSRFNMTFKNILTGGIASSNCGGSFGYMLKKSGYDGIIIKGKANNPITIEILDQKINIKDATKLWGLNTEEVQEKFPKKWGKLVIGEAGGNLVYYACAVSGERVAGRCGTGAALGAKNIKAIVTYGTKRIEVKNKEEFQKYIKKWAKFIKNHPMTGEILPKYGTANLVNKANFSKALPTRNFQKGSYEKADRISGETLSKEHLVKNNGCVSCPIKCERRVKVNGKEVKGPEFETVGLLGANIENSSLEVINLLNYHADLLGMDTISLAGTIAFAMELKEKGLADFGLEFGKVDNLLEVFEKIARREGVYSQLANGTFELSKIYGGEDFAIHSKGMELSAYEPRKSVGMGLGYATSNRGGCHLNGGYLALLESVGPMSIGSQLTKGKPELTVFMQNGMEAISSAGFCLFTLQTMVPAFLFKGSVEKGINKIAGKVTISIRGILGNLWTFIPWAIPINSMYLIPHAKAIELATGIKMTTGRLLQIGERGYNIERMYNIREGLTHEDDTLPYRLVKEKQEEAIEDSLVKLDDMLPRYYKIRGWDENGVPKPKKLKKLVIGK